MATKKPSASDTPKPPRKPRTPVDPNETKSEAFRRLAKKRVPCAVKAIASVANLTGASYEYTDDQRDKIIVALAAAVESATIKLRAEKERATPEFDI